MRKTVGKAAAVLLVLILLMTAVPAVYAEEPGVIGNVVISEAGIISWDAYPGAAEYRVGVRWWYKTTAETSYDLRSFIDEIVSYGQMPETGQETVTVRAYDGSGNMLAEWSQDYDYESSATPTPIGTLQNVKISDEGILSWDEWTGTDKYWVGIRGGYRTSPSDAPLTYDVGAYLDEFEGYGDLVKEGTHEIDIEANSVEGYLLAEWQGFVTVTKAGEGWDYKLFQGNEKIRLDGANRYETAIRAAEFLKRQRALTKFENIIIASGSGFPDALSASYLAYWTKAPILLVNNNTLGTVTDYAAENLAEGGKVYIIGGAGAVPEAVDAALAGTAGAENIVRFAGKNRYETNLMVLKECDKTGGLQNKELIFASGKGFADALSASAAKRPILLVGDVLLPEQADFIKEVKTRLSTGNSYIAGGTGAVSEAVEKTLREELGLTVKRYAGANRYETSLLIASDLFSYELDTVVIANAQNFPDGLSGGPVASYYLAPLLLVTDGYYEYAADYYKLVSSMRLVIMGGTGVISEETANAIMGE